MSNHEQEGASWGQIAVYGPEMAPRVAAMFNAFDELWPGGFAGRVPYDEQRVRDWLDDTRIGATSTPLTSASWVLCPG